MFYRGIQVFWISSPERKINFGKKPHQNFATFFPFKTKKEGKRIWKIRRENQKNSKSRNISAFEYRRLFRFSSSQSPHSTIPSSPIKTGPTPLPPSLAFSLHVPTTSYRTARRDNDTRSQWFAKHASKIHRQMWFELIALISWWDILTSKNKALFIRFRKQI